MRARRWSSSSAPHGQWRELAPLLDERAAAQADSSPDDARALQAGGGLAVRALDDRTQAIARYEALAAAEPRDLDVLRALERLYKADGQEQLYIASLGRQAEVAEPRERAAIYRRMASLYEELPGGAAGAEECLEKLLSVDSRSEDAYRSLERLYRRTRSGTRSSTSFAATRPSCRRRSPASCTRRSAPSTRTSCAIRRAPSTPSSTSRRRCPTTARRWRR